jgi:Ion channel
MTQSGYVSMFAPLLVALGTVCCTVVMHALVIGVIVMELRRDLRVGRLGKRYWANLTFVAGATLLAFVAHLAEIALWALVFLVCGEFSNFSAAFYHSGTNYTTLGYGDVIMSARWRLMGPLEAADGMLMFGVSTAVIFAVVQRLIQTRLGPSDD